MNTSVSGDQLKLLLDFMLEHQDLARNRMLRSIEGRITSKNLWLDLTNQLNAIGGAIKTTKQWQKVWSDKKYLAKKASAAANRSASLTGGGPADAPEVVDQDQQILQIMGESYGLPDTGAITDPFPRLSRDTNNVPEPAYVPEPANVPEQANVPEPDNVPEPAESELSEDSPQIFDIPPMTRQESLLREVAAGASQTTSHNPSPSQRESSLSQQESMVVAAGQSVSQLSTRAGSSRVTASGLGNDLSRAGPSRVTASNTAVTNTVTNTSADERGRRRGLRIRRPRSLPDDVRTRLFNLEEKKLKEMTEARIVEEKKLKEMTETRIVEEKKLEEMTETRKQLVKLTEVMILILAAWQQRQ